MEQEAVFRRYEKKYRMNRSAYLGMLERLLPFMDEDRYGDYRVGSVYFDTERFDLVRASARGPEFKEKLRLRYYGPPEEDEPVYLELKRKFRGLVGKRRIALSRRDAEELLRKGLSNRLKGRITEEMAWVASRYDLSPKLRLTYERRALRCKTAPSLRITFDRDIGWHREDLDLLSKDDGEPLVQPDTVIMEIKTDLAFPLWLSSLLSAERMYPVGFSKYGTWFQDHFVAKGSDRHVG